MDNKKPYWHLTFEQRNRIYLLNFAGISKQKIAIELGCNRSTIYRELKRNSCYYVHTASAKKIFSECSTP